ncbi:MAG TPA: hypothetical protein PK289_14200 [Bacteroidia bacterium]|nr:hypothetical protein [Bacteroidia bacterium]
MIIFNLVIRTASSVKKSLETAVKRAENGEIIDEHTFWMVVGMYESRRFGICSYRAKTTDFIDKLTDRYIATKK